MGDFLIKVLFPQLYISYQLTVFGLEFDYIATPSFKDTWKIYPFGKDSSTYCSTTQEGRENSYWGLN